LVAIFGLPTAVVLGIRPLVGPQRISFLIVIYPVAAIPKLVIWDQPHCVEGLRGEAARCIALTFQ
jgi:hypothetical protein